MATETTHHIQLIGAGIAPAVTADQLTVGDVTVWNYNYRATVLAITPKGKQSLIVTQRCHKSGNVNDRTMRRSTLVAVGS